MMITTQTLIHTAIPHIALPVLSLFVLQLMARALNEFINQNIISSQQLSKAGDALSWTYKISSLASKFFGSTAQQSSNSEAQKPSNSDQEEESKPSRGP